MSLSDEDRLKNHLMDLRGEARVYEAQAKADDISDDLRAFCEDISKSNWALARALHRLMDKAGIKGLGPLDY